MFLNLVAAAACVAAVVALAACTTDRTRAAEATSIPTTTTTSPQRVVRPSAPVDKLVAIESGRLHVRCHGRGDSTVVLIAGFESDASGWAKVEPALAKRTRVCAYDRFGTGTSEQPRATQTFATEADDLHALLTNMDEPGPYVVVGHSFGGAEAVEFASRFAGDVAGLALIDASPTTWPGTVCKVPAYASLCTQIADPSKNRERLDGDAAFAAVSKIDSLGALRTTVITGDKRQTTGLPANDVKRLNDAWTQGQQAWVGLSTAAKLVTLDKTSHYIQLDRPADVIHEISVLLP
jgi:pimeloyl-ACP methyl ester carboxylesterase